MRLLSIAKLQNLKAIHNLLVDVDSLQLVVINRKTTKFESNSQPSLSIFIVYLQLLSIAKLQNLKAIHNPYEIFIVYLQVVINRKTTKFESNSQRATL